MVSVAQQEDGWRMNQFGSPNTNELWLIELVPVNDTTAHFTGDECWCQPIVSHNTNDIPFIIHVPADKRKPPVF